MVKSGLEVCGYFLEMVFFGLGMSCHVARSEYRTLDMPPRKFGSNIVQSNRQTFFPLIRSQKSEYFEPRVSPCQLAAHLTSAFAIYSGLLWTVLSVVMSEPPAESLAWVNGATKVKRLVILVSLIVGVIGISGAFVAGNDAGQAYNTFPKMGDTWIPDAVLSMKPLLRNFFENTSTVQPVTTGSLYDIIEQWTGMAVHCNFQTVSPANYSSSMEKMVSHGCQARGRIDHSELSHWL